MKGIKRFQSEKHNYNKISVSNVIALEKIMNHPNMKDVEFIDIEGGEENVATSVTNIQRSIINTEPILDKQSNIKYRFFVPSHDDSIGAFPQFSEQKIKILYALYSLFLNVMENQFEIDFIDLLKLCGYEEDIRNGDYRKAFTKDLNELCNIGCEIDLSKTNIPRFKKYKKVTAKHIFMISEVEYQSYRKSYLIQMNPYYFAFLSENIYVKTGTNILKLKDDSFIFAKQMLQYCNIESKRDKPFKELNLLTFADLVDKREYLINLKSNQKRTVDRHLITPLRQACDQLVMDGKLKGYFFLHEAEEHKHKSITNNDKFKNSAKKIHLDELKLVIYYAK